MEAVTHDLFWLFLVDLFHQILFYFGGVVAMGILLWEKKRKKPIEWPVGVFLLSIVFVFIVFSDMG